jgi:PI-3-kinase-related kinase SMG-1
MFGADGDLLLLYLDLWCCPTEVVRGTLQSLISDAPSQLLAHELLLGAGTAPGWWCHKQHFTLTAATSSILGYLIGLGDRHLDNLLLERGSGEVVHIDYSVVWDKGQQLRVPEVVPFRLTSMLQVRA